MFNRINIDHYTDLPAQLRLRFEDGAPAGGTVAPPVPSPPPVAAPQIASEAPPTLTPAATAPVAPAEKVEELPPWAQKLISDTRKEAGDHRTAAKTAADAAQKELTDKLAVALGLKPDAAADPAALTASLTAAQQTATTAARELAIYKAAGTIANPVALLDSTSFLASVSGIDPTDGPAITAAINAAVLANPNLKAARAAGASSVDTPGGTGETGQITEAQLAQMSPEETAKAFAEGKLKHLLS